MKKLLLSVLLAVACSTGYSQNTNTITAPPFFGSGLSKVGTDIADFFKDNTNFWGQQTVMVGVNALYSNGKETGSTGGNNSTFGGAVDVRFPLDENGQISVGFFLAYFNNDFYDGSFSTTLGTTWNIPVINQPVFTFVEAGPAVNLANPDELLAQAFAGAVWKYEIVKATPKSSAWTLFVNGAYGKLTGWDGDIFLLGVEVGHKF